jgi:hypothetical protein
MRIDDLHWGHFSRADAGGNFCDGGERRHGHMRNRETMREWDAGQARKRRE